MSFSKEVKMQAFERAGGRCECTRKECGHGDRCQRGCESVAFYNKMKVVNGEEPVFPGFEFHHITAKSVGGLDVLSNCEFLCRECHMRTGAYGKKRE